MRLLTLLFIILYSSASAQPCSNFPGMTPPTAILVCGTTTFTQTNVTNCTAPAIVGPCISALVSGRSFWYKFHCYNAGITGLGFVISPTSGADDFDWTVFDVTGLPPNQVLTDISTQVSVNLCGFFGNTGASSTGIGNVNCEGNTNLWNQLVPMVTGHDYLLMVTNWSSSGQGYSLDFTGGDAQITNNLPPDVDSVYALSCNNSAQLRVLFSKDIRCSSVTPTGSEFLIIPGNIPATGITSLCSSGANSITELILNLAAPLAAGTYNLVVNPGTDGNTFLDACDIGITPGAQFPFTIAPYAPPVITGVTYTGCAPTVLNVVLSNPILCNSITLSGSEFSIPGGPVVTSVQSACGPGTLYTNTLQVHLQNPLPQGNYQLTINNGSDGNTLLDTCTTAIAAGYNFAFTISPSAAPVIQSVGFDECKPRRLVLNFDKPVTCNTISFLNSEFSITPGTWPIASVSSGTGCAPGGTTSQVIITLQNNLPAGNFNINVNNGADGNTVSDTCLSFIAPGYIKSFITTQAPSPKFDSVQFVKCNPSQIKVFYNHPINCGTVTAIGSEFFITGPSAVNIVSVSGDPATCSTSYSSWFILQLSQPINTLGTYVLHNQNGSDGNGMIDTCFASQNLTDTISFNVSVKPSAAFSNPVRWGCVNDTIDVSHPGGNGVNSWTWTFSDGTSLSTQTGTHTWPVATTNAGIQLIVSNGFCSDTSSVTIPLNNAFNTAFTQSADTICRNASVTFTNNSTGANLQHQWLFGDATTFNGLTPPAHIYTGNNNYTVSLISTNNHGCSDTATRNIYATALPVVAFTGLNAQYCTREIVSLTANIQGNISSYTWSNGNGQTFQNTASVNFSYNQQNAYTITLSANDRFCGTSVYKDTTQVYHMPVVNLGRDTMLCPAMRLQLGIPDNNTVTYLWNTGAITSHIITDLLTRTYILVVDNHGCIGQDDIHVEMLDGCLIRVPGAFTPNNDGTNDRLKAINAFLATGFTLQVYNRFGQMMFSTSNPVEGWDGRFKGQEAAAGTYVWQLSYIDPWTSLPVYQKGTSILIR